jgi:hypothetical protein
MTYEELHAAANKKALELLEGCGPYHNIVPTKELVMAAWAMGYDVVKLPPATAAEKQP